MGARPGLQAPGVQTCLQQVRWVTTSGPRFVSGVGSLSRPHASGFSQHESPSCGCRLPPRELPTKRAETLEGRRPRGLEGLTAALKGWARKFSSLVFLLWCFRGLWMKSGALDAAWPLPHLQPHPALIHVPSPRPCLSASPSLTVLCLSPLCIVFYCPPFSV